MSRPTPAYAHTQNLIINRVSPLDKMLRHYRRITAPSPLSSCRQIVESDPIPHLYVSQRTKSVQPISRPNRHRLLLHAHPQVLEFLYSIFPLANRIRDRCNSRILAMTMLPILGTSTLTKNRNYSFRAFFILHVILSMSLLPILYLHFSHLRIYILESAAIYVLLILQRNISSTFALATILHLPSTSLLSVSLRPKAPFQLPKSIPGQHVYLSFIPSADASLSKLRLNPFTIAKLPTKDGNMLLIIRLLSGRTNILSKLAETYVKHQPTPIIIEDPYGSAS